MKAKRVTPHFFIYTASGERKRVSYLSRDGSVSIPFDCLDAADSIVVEVFWEHTVGCVENKQNLLLEIKLDG